MASSLVKFRRHLTICLVLLLIREIHLDLSNQSENQNKDEPKMVRELGASYFRFRPASAFEQQHQQQQQQFSAPAKLQRLQQEFPASNHEDSSGSLNKNNLSDGRMNDDNDDDPNIIRATLDFIGYYLPTLNFNYTLVAKEFDNQQLDYEVENYYRENFPLNMTLDELHLQSIKASLRTAPMPIHLSWGYASRAELRASSLPVQDDSRCSAHLSQLSQRLDRLTSSQPAEASSTNNNNNNNNLLESQRAAMVSATPPRSAAHEASPVENYEAAQLFRSSDLQFLRYLDTFGRVPSDLLRGNTKWYGSYAGCLNTKLKGNQQFGGTKRIKFRYCLAALKSLSWSPSSKLLQNKLAGTEQDLSKFLSSSQQQQQQQQQSRSDQSIANSHGVHSKDIRMENYFLRVGVCLPESCDSSAIDYQENWLTIEKLMKFNLMKPFNSDHYYLSDLYCLPDSRSPLRTIPLMGKLLILATIGWLAFVLLATTVHLNVERFYIKAVKEIRREQQQQEQEEKDEPTRGLNFDFNNGANMDSSSNEAGCLRSGSSRTSSNGELDRSKANNELAESDILNIKHKWIKLNVYLWDLSKRLISGVDLIACFSLYSNWLKYTSRLKLAIVELNTDQERRARINKRGQQLIDNVRNNKNSTASEKGRFNCSGVGGAATKSIGKKISAGSENVSANSAQRLNKTSQEESSSKLVLNTNANVSMNENQIFDKELNRRIKAQDDSDELDSDYIKKRVDTSSLNALKVIALLWIIAGHCIFYLGSTISDGAILMNYVRDISAFALANGALYITELFFVITGCLTAYLAFKYNTYKVKINNNNNKQTTDCDDQLELREQRQTSASSGGFVLGSASSGAPIRRDEEEEEQQEQEQQEEKVELFEETYLESRIFRLPFWLMICINRYLRILPTYLLVYSYIKLVSVYVGGYGQLWDYAVSPNSMRRECVRESWLPVLTLTTNFVDIYNHCIVGGWYLSADMQFMLMSVPLLLVLAYCQQAAGIGKKGSYNLEKQFVAFSKHQQLTINTEYNGAKHPYNTDNTNSKQKLVNKRILFGYSFIFMIGLLSGLLSIIYGLYHSEIDLTYILKFVPHTIAVLSRNIAMYTNSIFRLRAFAFGLILGHLLYLYEFKLIKLPKFIQLHGSKVTTIVFTIGFCIMFLPIIYPQGKIIISHDLTTILMILTAGAIDLFLCILIFLICIGKAPKAILFFLNSPFWTLLSSLSLCAFLLHTEIIVLLTSQLNPPQTVQYSLLLFVFSATLILTYISALALYLSFEMPVSRLIEAIMRKFFSSSKVVKSDHLTTTTTTMSADNKN